MPDQTEKKIPRQDDVSPRDKSYVYARREEEIFAKGLSLEKLRSLELGSLHVRNERLRIHFDRVITCLLYILSSVWVVLFLVWIWHIVGPKSCRWLNENDIGNLKWMVTAGGFLVPIASRTLKRLDCGLVDNQPDHIPNARR